MPQDIELVEFLLSNYHGLLTARSSPESKSDHEEADPDLRDFVTPRPKPNPNKKYELVLANV